jgi:proteasome lid subunit RPN8/RPN11
VRSDVVDLICQAARANHPNEFGGILRADKADVITDLLLLPGTVSGATHAVFQLHMLPIDFSVRGTVHSHPSGTPRPSEADLELFRRFGRRHIIIGSPYDRRSWRAYDGRGDAIRAEVVE